MNTENYFSVLIVDKHDQTIGQKIEQTKRPRFKGEAGSLLKTKQYHTHCYRCNKSDA